MKKPHTFGVGSVVNEQFALTPNILVKYGGQNVPGLCLGQAQTLNDMGALLQWVASSPPRQYLHVPRGREKAAYRPPATRSFADRGSAPVP